MAAPLIAYHLQEFMFGRGWHNSCYKTSSISASIWYWVYTHIQGTHQDFSPVHTCDSNATWLRFNDEHALSLVHSHYKTAEAVQQWSNFFLFHWHYPKILRVQPKKLKDCRSRLGLFTWSKNPPSATEDAQRLSKQTRFDSLKILNAVRTPNRNRVAKRWRHYHESLSSHAESHSKSQVWTGLFWAVVNKIRYARMQTFNARAIRQSWQVQLWKSHKTAENLPNKLKKIFHNKDTH